MENITSSEGIEDRNFLRKMERGKVKWGRGANLGWKRERNGVGREQAL